MSAPRIVFLGMTHLGVVSAAAAAMKGFDTLGVDPDAARIAALQEGRPPVSEPGLEAALAETRGRLRFSQDFADVAEGDLVVAAADVPTDGAGRSDLTMLRGLIGAARPHLAPSAVFVVLAQTPPGFTRALPIAPERLFYLVETLVFGRALERALEPERFMVGAADPSAPLAPAFAAYLRAFGCPVLPMAYESAELSKIAINIQLVASITAANMMAGLCEKIGADWSDIAPALRLDARIGRQAYLTPGLGLAGGNLERDMATVARLADAADVDAGLITAAIALSGRRKLWAAERLTEALEAAPALANAPIGLLGLTYKENTHSMKNAPSLATLAAHAERRFVAHDPAAPREAAPGVQRVEDPLAAADGAAAVLILTPWPEYREIDPAALAARMAGRTLIDPFGVIAPAAAKAAGLTHHVLGRSAHGAAADGMERRSDWEAAS